MIITDDQGAEDQIDPKQVKWIKMWKDKLVWLDVWILEICFKEDRKCIHTIEYTYHLEEKARYYYNAVCEKLDSSEGNWRMEK